MSKQVVLFFHHSAAIGGAGISGLYALNALCREKYEVVIYCFSNNGEMNQLYKSAGYEVIDAGFSPVSYMHYSGGETFAFSLTSIKNIFLILKDTRKISSIIQRINPDIVIINSMTLFWIGKIAKKFNKKTVCFFRETYAKGLIGIRTCFIKNQLNRYIDSIAFISKYDMEQNLKLKCKKCVIYNTVKESDYFKISKIDTKNQLNLSIDKKYVLYVGGMSRLKGADVIIRAMRQLGNTNVTLIFVGYLWNGRKKTIKDCQNIKQKLRYLFKLDYEANCINYILNNSLSNQILFFPPQTDIANFYAACDALVFPATKPHQARPLIEAGYAKIPAIVTNFPNFEEFQEKGLFYTFENKNSLQLARIIIDALNNRDRSLLEKNYRYTKERHNEVTYKKQIQGLVDEVSIQIDTP